MIISQGRRYIFVHIPKTGGTALTLALEARAMKDDILIGDTPKAQARKKRLKDLPAKGRLWKHATLADLDGLFGAAELDRYFIFSLVRNPWDRAVSYYHWLRDQGFAHPAVTLAQQTSFSAFLNHPQTRTSFQNWPASAYLRDASGVEHCQLYIRLEHLAQDIAPLEAHLGFSLTPLPRANRSARDTDWRGYYSDADAALIARICAEDITRFGYRFDDAATSRHPE
ncbi:Type II secretory pathway, pullulanase PulA [Pseudorhodobacter sp. E13]|uniref:sulfotransferase family 2 domain-containing protein n=1 Tax=Pseudorhodobacter sp. E13 TaxID=2487931 RepID=UPI000F8E3212|nr:sulfotransferase family 2 domain-containing protein [Pseudorhodobacter sp. E13]RUS65169.1 Type II secretory pathway, pullulanase PulA [Pseudorhodobacter sp. E13]